VNGIIGRDLQRAEGGASFFRLLDDDAVADSELPASANARRDDDRERVIVSVDAGDEHVRASICR